MNKIESETPGVYIETFGPIPDGTPLIFKKDNDWVYRNPYTGAEQVVFDKPGSIKWHVK